MSRHLLVFAKAPQPGRVKTRLTPEVPPEDAAGLARAFLQDVLTTGERLPDADLTLVYAPRGARGSLQALAGPRWRVRVQRGCDLGERLTHAFAARLRSARDRVLIVGADSPLLSPERLAEAFTALDRADLVIGPCDDGGYYLIGLRRWVAGLLSGVRWSTTVALADTLANARRLRLSCAELESDYDVDDARSLARLIEDLRRLPAERAPFTRAELARQGRWDGA
ncbi:MAG: glycosyltransferase [Armatimonadetes bacterium]|nr:glycosyltransferase [Armatimonadota bacterium]